MKVFVLLTCLMLLTAGYTTKVDEKRINFLAKTSAKDFLRERILAESLDDHDDDMDIDDDDDDDHEDEDEEEEDDDEDDDDDDEEEEDDDLLLA